MHTTLPDGSIRDFDGPVTGAQITGSICPGLLKAAVAIAVNGTEQVQILTVSEKSESHGSSVKNRLDAAGLRVHLDDRSDKIGFKIREAHKAKVPWMAIVGEQELENDSVSLRLRTDLRGRGIPETLSVDEFTALAKDTAARPF